MAIGKIPFLGVTQPQYNQNNYNVNNSNYSYQGQTAPKSGSFKPSVEDYEKAQAYLNGEINTGFGTQGVSKIGQSQNVKGSAFDGFSVPQNNGTGELIPQYEDGEHKLLLMA